MEMSIDTGTGVVAEVGIKGNKRFHCSVFTSGWPTSLYITRQAQVFAAVIFSGFVSLYGSIFPFVVSVIQQVFPLFPWKDGEPLIEIKEQLTHAIVWQKI